MSSPKKLTIKIELELSPKQLADHFILCDNESNVILDSWNACQDDLAEKIKEALMEADPVVGHLWQLTRMSTNPEPDGGSEQCSNERVYGWQEFRRRVARMAKEYLLKNYAVPESFYCAGQENRVGGLSGW